MLSVVPRFPSAFFWLNKVGLHFYYQLLEPAGLWSARVRFSFEVGEDSLAKRNNHYSCYLQVVTFYLVLYRTILSLINPEISKTDENAIPSNQTKDIITKERQAESRVGAVVQWSERSPSTVSRVRFLDPAP